MQKLPGTSPQTVIVPCSDSYSSSVCPPSFSPVSDWEETLASIHSTQSGNGSSSGEAEEPGIGSHNSASSSETCEQSNPTPQEISPAPQEISLSPDLQWPGLKIVGDNVDKNIKPSLQRITHQTKSLHYFLSCAVKDRVNLSTVSDVSRPLTSDLNHFVMSVQDWNQFKDICQVITSR